MNDVKILCHANDPHYPIGSEANDYWREPNAGEVDRDGYTRDQHFRTCSYCGSIHPEDLLRELQSGANLGGSDWKYGWPHKFYVEGIKSTLDPNVDVKRGSNGSRDGNTAIMGKPSQHVHAKFYSIHLTDLVPEDFDVVSKAVYLHGGIQFELDEKSLKYKAPYRGYQQ